MIARDFVFLQIAEQATDSLIVALKALATGRDHWRGASLTVRGPCEREPTPQEMSEFEQKLDSAPLLIGGVGRFSNFDEEVVYLNVSCDNLPKIWDKLDYPTEGNGMYPHITIYRGQDRQWAEQLKLFLLEEKIKILCKNYRLAPYRALAAKPGRLPFGLRTNPEYLKQVENNLLEEKMNCISQGILTRLRDLSEKKWNTPSVPNDAGWQASLPLSA